MNDLPRTSINRYWPQVTALLLIAVELCWVVPWFRTVIQITYVASPLRATLVLGTIMLSSFLLSQLLDELRLRKGLMIAALVVLLVLSLIFGSRILLNAPAFRVVSGIARLDPGAVLVLLTAVWLWWRGITLAREIIRPGMAFRHFELGLLMLLAQVLIVSLLPANSTARPVGVGLFVFYLFIGLLAVVFARVSYVGMSQKLMENPFDRHWAGLTLGVLAGAVGFSAVLGSLLTGQYTLLLDWLAETFKLLLAVVVFIASLPALLLARLLEPFGPIIQKLLARPTPTPDLYPSPQALLPGLSNSILPTPFAIQVLIFWSIVLILLILIFIRLRRRMGLSRENARVSESLLQPGEASSLLRKSIQELFSDLTGRLRPDQRHLAAAQIRRIYALLMDLCQELNTPRPEAQTPLEFLPVMVEMFPTFVDELDKVTRAYNAVRYGELPESQDEVNSIEEAWKRIQAEGQRLKRAGFRKAVPIQYKPTDDTEPYSAATDPNIHKSLH
jgi:hypothetical protein